MSASNPMLNDEQGAVERAPELATRMAQPGGVIRRNLKMQVYLGIAVLFIVATAVSSLRHKPTTKQQNQATPMAQTSDANIEEMRKSLELQWGDFDWENQTVLIRRGVVNGRIGDTKTEASRKALPVSSVLAHDLARSQSERCRDQHHFPVGSI
jgi:hypothetical protein